MKQLFQKINMLKVLSFFFDNPYSLEYLREIARKTKTNPATSMRYLQYWEKQNLITRIKKKNSTYYKANINPFFKHLKISYSMEKIIDSGLIDKIKDSSSALLSVVLYGSVAKGIDTKDSDIDIIIISKHSDITSLDASTLLKRETNLKKYSVLEWKKCRKDNKAFYFEVISTGINLYGDKLVI